MLLSQRSISYILKASVELLNVIHWLYGYASSSFVIISCKNKRKFVSSCCIFFFNTMMCNDAHLKRGLNVTSVEYVHWSCQPWKVTSCKQSWLFFDHFFFFQIIFGVFLEKMVKMSVLFLPISLMFSKVPHRIVPH